MPRGRQVVAAERPAGLRPRPTKAEMTKPTRNSKRLAEENMENNAKNRKRAAFGDITNAVSERQSNLKKQVKKGLSQIVNRSKAAGSVAANNKASAEKKFKLAGAAKSNKKDFLELTGSQSLPSSQQEKLEIQPPAEEEEAEESVYESAEENVDDDQNEAEPLKPRYQPPSRPVPPPGVVDFDLENWKDPMQCSEYAMDIFRYYKTREDMFCVSDYMGRQRDITKTMRAILVDWLVEVQESFELNHETLYTAVKILDLYMSQVKDVPKEDLQLVGATGCLIACKIDERIPPLLDDFVYVCDDAYTRNDIMAMERNVLKVVGMDVGYPLSYRFLRRYGRVCKTSMPVLTLARYILETSLIEYKFNVDTSESKLAAAALMLAFKINKIGGWVNTLAFYSGYLPADVNDLVQSLFQMLKQYPKENLGTVRQKYSHRVFHEVALIPLPETIDLTESG